jgi:hypothetical protein
VPNPDHGELTPAATGERIVAFARPGKPPENGFSRPDERVPGNAGAANSWGFATVSKACRGRDVPTDLSIGSEKMAAANKKREARKSLHQPGWVTLDGGFAARQCVVQDLSSTGAKITVEDDASVLAGSLRLAFSRDARTGRRCEVVWRRGKSFGVKFVR